jgi:hypothetical protein
LLEFSTECCARAFTSDCLCVAAWCPRHGMRQVNYPAGQVSPTALVSALTRAGVGADTLNSVAGKLLAAPYLQGGVSLDALSMLRDRDMHGGPVKPIVVLAVRKALGVRLPCRVRGSGPQHSCGLREATPHGCCIARPGTRVLAAFPFVYFECRSSF